MPVFITLGTIGFILLLISFAFDHEHDYSHGDSDSAGDGHSGPGVLNLKVIASFLTAFGAGGLIAHHQYKFDMMVSSLMGLASGCALALVVYLALRWVYGLQGSSLATTSDIVGQMARVSVGISPGKSGEVMLAMKGSQYSYPARTLGGETFKEGDVVKVVNFYAETAIVQSVPVTSRSN